MRTLERQDIVGKTITDIIISMPDKPVSMSDMSSSDGFLRIDSGVLVDIGAQAPPLLACDEVRVRDCVRDTKYELEFRSIIGERIIDVVLTSDLGCICVVTESGSVITFVPAQFWVRPCIYEKDEFDQATEPLWPKPVA